MVCNRPNPNLGTRAQVEKTSDDTVKLKILQTALTLLQNPRNVDDKVGKLLNMLCLTGQQQLSIRWRRQLHSQFSAAVLGHCAGQI